MDRTFSAKEALAFVEVLRLYLSFARGAFCSLTLLSGSDRSGETCWEQWGTHVVSPWGFSYSWFDTRNGRLLAEVFPGFWNRLNDPRWSDTIRASLYWYLRSNGHGLGAGVDGGLILSQAALERLAYVQLGRTVQRASDLIREALTSMRIPTTIPKRCKHLRRIAGNCGWQDAPHAIVEVRNELVHPRQKHGASLGGAYYEAWNLAQRYIELMLLRLFGHKGFHANRISQEWRGQVVRVPWA